MADNIQLNPAVGGGDVARAEDVGGGVKIPASKIYVGPHGVDGGPVTATNPLPVVLVDGGGDGATADVVQPVAPDLAPVDALATYDVHTPLNPLSIQISDNDTNPIVVDVDPINGKGALGINLVDPSLRDALESTRVAVETLVDLASA